MSTHIHIPLQEGMYYHIYNRGNDQSNIFFNESNYSHFLKKYDAYLSGHLETYAFSLLPNHFHLLVRVKSKNDILKDRSFPSFQNLESLTIGEIVSEFFRRFFMSYSKSINKQENRTGSLFQKNFRRKHVDNDAYLTQVIYYIHNQLAHHGFNEKNDQNYKWNSYQRILNDRSSHLMKQEVLHWFGGKQSFISYHQSQQDLSTIKDLLIDN